MQLNYWENKKGLPIYPILDFPEGKLKGSTFDLLLSKSWLQSKHKLWFLNSYNYAEL